MAHEFKLTRQVEFSDTDMAGIVHFSNFFRYMEAVEHAFFRSLGFSINTTGFDEPLGWPRVHASCEYKGPLRFEDNVEIHLLVREKKEKSLAYTIIFRRQERQGAQEIARGILTVVCVKRDGSSGKLTAVPIPATIAERIEVAPEELF